MEDLITGSPMQYETKKRSILKALSWRTWATITTAIIVFIFTGEVALAVTVGFLEVFAKMGLYFFHERLWQKIRFGKKAVADKVYQELLKVDLKVERLDSHDVRPLFPETGFAPQEVNRHVKRAGHLCSMLEKNGVIVVASFVSPYAESRHFARSVATNFVEVYMKSTVEACAQRDENDHYAKARRGEYQNFPDVDAVYEAPENAEFTVDVDEKTTDEAALQIVDYLKKNFLNCLLLNNT